MRRINRQGRVRVRASRPGTPRQQDGPLAPDADARRAGPVPECGQGPLRVLLIEGEEDVAGAVLRGLARAGMSATWASRGRVGLALRDSVRPHVVLVDPVLPDMSGPSLVTLLTRPRDCGVVVFSGGAEDAARTGSGHQADDFIAKPSTMREIVARVRAVHLRVNPCGG